MFRVAFLVAFALSGCSAADVADPVPDPPRFRLVAYVHGGTPGAIARIGAEKLTHVNYAFANVTPDGEVVLEGAADADRLRALVGLRERNPSLKVLLAIGGWSWSDHFSDAALTSASRSRFAESAAALVRDHDLDGIDVDWEYPGQPGEGNTHRPEDRETFTLLLEAVRDALEDGQLVTIAAAAGQRYLDHTNMAAAHRHLDFVNLMTYDYAGAWSARTAHHANLYPSASGGASSSRAVEQMVAAGVPASKVVLGAAFYGYEWRGVEGGSDGLGRPFSGAVTARSYADLEAGFIDRGGFRRVWDEGAQAPTLWNAASRTFISYEDPASVAAKAAYARSQGLGGLMYWQHHHDPAERLLDAARRGLEGE